MDRLVQKLVDEIQAEQDQQSVDSRRFVEEQKIRREMAPRLWNELREWLKQACTDAVVGGRPVFRFAVGSNLEAVISRNDKPISIEINFSQDAQRVFYECGAGRGEYLVQINSDATVSLSTPYHQPFSVPEVGYKLLELLKRSNF